MLSCLCFCFVLFFLLSLNLGNHTREDVKSTCISADALQYENAKKKKKLIKERAAYNRPFPSWCEPHYESEAKCKTFQTKISFVYILAGILASLSN